MYYFIYIGYFYSLLLHIVNFDNLHELEDQDYE
jgi:hypothetical protein